MYPWSVLIFPTYHHTLSDLISGISNDTDYEISTKVAVDTINPTQIQKMTNKLFEDGRISIKSDNGKMDSRIIITRATKENINDVNSILGNINGISDEITIRIYDSTDDQINAIKDKYDVINIRTF